MGKYQTFLQKFPEVKKDTLLSPLTTYKVGGKADLFLATANEKLIKDASELAARMKIKTFFLGGGSNVVFSDRGFRGLIVKLIAKPTVVKSTKIIVSAGSPLEEVVKTAAQNSLSGLEWAAGIPGTLGGAVYGNAGAWGQDIAKTFVEATILTPSGKIQRWKNKDFCFSYRSSRLKKIKGKHIILSVVLKLASGNQKKIKQEMEENIKNRGHLPIEPSAGCIFKNIIATEKIAKKIPNEAIKHGKIPVGWLIESLGLKGKKIGGAIISPEHANFIINTGKARASDIKKLKDLIKKKVKERFGIILEEEVEFVE
ncbi:UDP-N-acetylmuramate dehydrogenase [Candidatus Microgenomates bacterium]|nr:UDP-N-acetylmuramate dehydrogenase [Candidatus Microgenomates bacterium]